MRWPRIGRGKSPGVERLDETLPSPRVPPDTRVFAIGDIHGRADLLRKVFESIDTFESRFPTSRSVEILIGDYVDRGPDSRGVIDLVLDRQTRREVVALAGNHEEMLLRALVEPGRMSDWLANGGRETLLSYGIALERGLMAADAEPLRKRMFETLPGPHLKFLIELPPSYACGDYFFVHAGVRPNVPLDQQCRDDLLWIRDDFLSARTDFGAMIVHGHTPTEAPDIRPNRINIDTGAYATGRLTCLVIEGTSLSFL